MKTRTEPLLGAAMFGIVILLITSVTSNIMVYNNMNNAIRSALAGVQPATISPIFSILGCLFSIIGGVGTGIIYAILHNREEPLTGNAARGGAAAGALAYAIAAFASSILALVLISPLIGKLSAAMDMPSEVASQVMGFGLIGGVIGALCGTAVMAVPGAILGAIGGAIGTAVVK